MTEKFSSSSDFAPPRVGTTSSDPKKWRFKIGLYLKRQASSPGRYLLEQTVMGLTGWIPTIAGIGLRGLAYRLILKMDGMAAIERKVRIRFAGNLRLGHGC